MHKGFFITGTDTDAGKTWISLGIVEALKQQGYKVGVMKPVSAGCQQIEGQLRNEDALMLQQQCNIDLDYNLVNPYAFEPAIAPHIAAADAGIHLDIETLYKQLQTIKAQSDCVVVEGAGGWAVPINDFQTMADLAQRFQLPVILVVNLKLGCLNHTLLTTQAIQQQGLPLAGWIANQVQTSMARQEENIQTLTQFIDAPLLGVIPHLKHLNPTEIANHLQIELEPASLKPTWVI